MARAISWGFKRGAFSNEAGLGASVLVHCAANVEEPVQQGMWGMFEVFADTMVVCTLTALVVLTSGLVDLDTGAALTDVEGSALVGQAFSTVFGAFGPQFIAVSVLLFAYSTTLGWSHYGTRAVVYLLGERAAAGYKLVFAAMVLVGAVMKLDLAWALSDTFNGLMMLPNLVGVVGLSGVVVRETQAYLKRNDPLRPCSLSVRCGMERVILYRFFFILASGAGRFEAPHRVTPGGDAAAKGPVQVEAAAAAGAVQRFTHKVKAGAALELEAGGHFGQAQAAAGGLGLLPAAGGQALEQPVLGRVGQHLPGGIRQGVHRFFQAALPLPTGRGPAWD
mgnify:CR=1 FL=1